MKRKMHGAVYNTETATKIASWKRSDFERREECLYRTKSGKFFRTEYVIEDVSGSKRKEAKLVIRPLSRADAIRLTCQMFGVSHARLLFYEREPEGGMQVNACVSLRTHRILRAVASERGISIGKLIDELVEKSDLFDEGEAVFAEMKFLEAIEKAPLTRLIEESEPPSGAGRIGEGK